MYSLERHAQIGLGDGVSTYYSHDCTTADAELAQKFLDSAGISPYNTRVLELRRYRLEVASRTCVTKEHRVQCVYQLADENGI